MANRKSMLGKLKAAVVLAGLFGTIAAAQVFAGTTSGAGGEARSVNLENYYDMYKGADFFCGSWVWHEDANTWSFVKDDGTTLRSRWQWIDHFHYAFDENGYLYRNCTTPDGNKVNADGQEYIRSKDQPSVRWCGNTKTDSTGDDGVNSSVKRSTRTLQVIDWSWTAGKTERELGKSFVQLMTENPGIYIDYYEKNGENYTSSGATMGNVCGFLDCSGSDSFTAKELSNALGVEVYEIMEGSAIGDYPTLQFHYTNGYDYKINTGSDYIGRGNQLIFVTKCPDQH